MMKMEDTGVKYQIRRFSKKDLPAVHQLVIHTIEVSYREFFSPEAIDFFREYHSRENILKDSAEGYTIVAELNDEIVGTGTLLESNIRRVYIEPSCQRKGIGKLIFRELERKAALKNLPSLDLAGNSASRPFWEAMGFTISEEYFLPVKNDKKLHYYVMVKKNGL